MKRAALVAMFAVGLVALALASGMYAMQRFMGSPVNLPGEGALFEIAAGSSFKTVASDLVVAGIIEDDFWFRLYARQSGEASAIQAGEYKLEQGATPRTILDQFLRGSVRLYSFAIIEGWNHRDLLQALHANDAIKASMTDEDWPAFLESLGATVTHPEGLFLPETYHIPRNTTDRQVLTQAYELMQRVLAEEWQARGEAAPVDSPYEALVLASIVEKETARADERPRIAGVFARRLKQGMRLQTDPTVIYGIGAGFDGNLTRQHLRTDTTYNTYTRKGLPPTPIAMPGRDAINAVLHPTEGEELYFVATGLGDGSHKFSVTKAEHDAAVAEYLQRLRQQRRKGR
jgi:UPF0755 protein